MKNWLLPLLCSLPILATAQFSSDALLFGETHQSVTARGLGSGNILGGLGADLSNASTNPAGLGVYRKTEIGISLGSLTDITQNSFLTANSKEQGRYSQLAFGGIGALITMELDDYSEWKFVNFGMSVNRLANFGQDIELAGTNEGSRLLSIRDAANGFAPNDLYPYESQLAYDAYLIDLDGNNTNTYVAAVIPSDIIEKRQSVERKGGITELGFSMAANYQNKLYLGATLGIDFLNYKDYRFYSEAATNDTISFVGFDFSEYRNVTGTGINLKLGMLYRVNKVVRVGFSIHTPTAYRLSETYDTELGGTVYYNNVLRDSSIKSPIIQQLQHNYVSPWVFAGNVGIVIGKRGFIGIEAIYKDYSWSKFSLIDADDTPDNRQFMSDLNRQIERSYTGTFNIGIGGEVNFGLARVRAGYRLQTSPYQQSVVGVSDLRHDISAGFGLRWKHFFLDLAYVHTLRQFEYIPYNSDSQPQRVTSTRQTSQVMLTMGFSIFQDDEVMEDPIR